MIAGTVNNLLEPVTPLELVDATGQIYSTDAIIDTGFTGHLFLPPDIIRKLGFGWITREQLAVTGGYIHFYEVYRTSVLSDGALIEVDALEADGMPLIGTALLAGYSFSMETRPGGQVTINKLP